MEFKNVEKFEAWLEENLKHNGTYDLQAVLDDVENRHDETGTNNYELKGYETNSGRPEIYRYDAEINEVEEDYFETVITF